MALVKRVAGRIFSITASVSSGLGIGLGLGLSAQPAPALAAQASNQAPKYLAQRVETLGRQFPGRVGISVESFEDGWLASWEGERLYPQQSVSKLWVAITALDAADKSKVSLKDKVTLTRSDLTLFHQPIAAKILGSKKYTTTLEELLVKAITTSDNTANDKLMRSVGGPEAVRRMIREKGLGTIRFYDGEKALQSKIAGLLWSPGYSIGGKFWEARNALPYKVREAAFEEYIVRPYDGAKTDAIVHALVKLGKGQLLRPELTRKLLSIMSKTKTGPRRLKGGLKPGWTLSHKTGTGQELGKRQAGYNDIGILTAPDGKSYAVAVMIGDTAASIPARMKLMNQVVEAVVAQHEMTYAPSAVRR